MAKTNNKVKKAKASSAYQRKVTGMYKQVQAGTLDAAALHAAAMYADPCGAELAPTVYPGDRGYVNRFTSVGTLGALATQTAFVAIWRPSTQGFWNFGAATSGTAGTVTYSTDFPGLVFLNTNASKARCGAFCATVRPIAAPNTATGTLYFGVVNARALRSGLSLTPDNIIPLCSESVSAAQALMAPLEVRWCPGDYDGRYSEVNNPNVSADDSDVNVLVVVGTGFPVASGCQFKATSIMEWTPNSNLGIVNDATLTKPSVCDKECVLNYLKRKDRNWWWSLGTKALKIGKGAVTGFYTGGAVGALGGALKYM